MSPPLPQTASLQTVAAFAAALDEAGFEGDIELGLGERVPLSTDNSVYEILPDAVLYPADTQDLSLIARIGNQPEFRAIALRPRGGGTGTNGQSLGPGVIVDLSRHMRAILDIDAQAGWVLVHAGVVKDQLEARLNPLGLFFPPELSTSSRATLGGMISTDACGQGSCLYGKTRHYVEELTLVLDDGTIWTTGPLDEENLARECARQDRVGAICRHLREVAANVTPRARERFPKLNRSLTGYDLANLVDDKGRITPAALVCGGEGTLCFVAEARLRVLPLPRAKALLVIAYDSFDTALRDAPALTALGAASIETIDSKVLALAQADPHWHEVAPAFPATGGMIKGVNLVEFVDEAEAALDLRLEAIAEGFASSARLGHRLVRGALIGRVWAMRKRAVGLLGATAGAARPVPFVEDTAVPPEHLADFIAEFRALLDHHGLDYGMFGHVDAGVLHVRPAMDMSNPAHAALLSTVTEAVYALTRRYGGLLWGEHGKGLRSVFVPGYFGDLYPALVGIKSVFDPHNRFNPGKIAAPDATPLLGLKSLGFRGTRDADLPVPVRSLFSQALACNGNGACHDWDPDHVMCPSYKATRARRHSPKGRAALLREWVLRLSAQGVDLQGALEDSGRTPLLLPKAEEAFTEAVKEALDGCLGCKGCAGQCPVRVDIPALRSKFLSLYHQRFSRPLRDYLLASLESLAPLIDRVPKLYEAIRKTRLARRSFEWLRLVHLPDLKGERLRPALKSRGVAMATAARLAALNPRERARSVVIVPDVFSGVFDTAPMLAMVDLMLRLGFQPLLAPLRTNGKALHVLGFRDSFERVAKANAALLAALVAHGVPLVGLEPPMTLAYRDEYCELAAPLQVPKVLLIEEWLTTVAGFGGAASGGHTRFRLAPHCTERALAPAATQSWREVFARFGLELEVLEVGCCGMAGTFGHLAEQRQTSEEIFARSWQPQIARKGAPELLATGFSCRCQTQLITGRSLRHPVEVLLAELAERHSDDQPLKNHNNEGP